MLHFVTSSIVSVNGIPFSDSISTLMPFMPHLNERVNLEKRCELKKRMWSWGVPCLPPDVTFNKKKSHFDSLLLKINDLMS